MPGVDREGAKPVEVERGSWDVLSALIANLPGSAVFVVDVDLRYQIAGGPALEFAGYDAAQLVGRSMVEVLGEQIAGLFTPNVREVFNGTPFLLDHQSGGRFFITRGVPLGETVGRVQAALLLSHDVTEAKAAEAALVLERERRVHREQEFIANAAHEFLNPLAGILGAVDALRAGAVDEAVERDRFLAHLRREALRMSRLADSLLTLARADSHEDLRSEAVDVRELLDEVAAQIRALPGVRVSVEAPDGLVLHTDRGLLEIVVSNLASNAAKYTPRGSIDLCARSDGDALLVEVSDSGLGMTALAQERAADRFYRDGPRSSDGFGLGLSIAQQGARVLGAELTLRPGRPQGTIACVRFAS